MRSTRFILLAWLVAGAASAQDYPYEDSEIPPEQAPDTAPLPPPTDLPVEVPEASEAPVPLKKGTRASQLAVPKRVKSIFRMGLKGGGNFTHFTDTLCTAADNLGCFRSLPRSFDGFGVEGRLSFGWDLAYQPLFIETELGYRRMLMNSVDPLDTLQLQQGLFYRSRIGPRSLWKPGVVMALNLQLARDQEDNVDTALFPAFGLASIWEFDAFLFQLTGYVHELASGRSFLSSSALIGFRF